ncbi:hypothetical protein SAMN02745121_08159 [Nannocystis exedens]|uniref:Thioredoxin domain-containing protein n=1 Tax=Nannocystis exedens TaxID=54 RepID=A0A1I2HT89_9BACT|nr:hypothetical protein [Nannocystis exedens]PCC69905.1 hypothetical protein NAEX_02932 [Nannocystis exedens]SFF32530.1 hypothetical protein SAMN02745121_08159 [Nannocystis exedens]
MKTTPLPVEPEVPRAWVRAAFVLLFSTAMLSGLTLVLTWRLEEQTEALKDLRARAASCPAPTSVSPERPVEVEQAAPPPPSAPLGSGSYVSAGVDIGPLMRLRLERVRQGAPAGTVRFGSSEVLSPRAVHVVGLWAPWCVACKEVLPDLREMFARRSESWGDSVRFLPVQVLDPTAPEDAIRTWGPLMPPSAMQLADRSLADSFVAALRDDSRRLYQGSLPVTLALDCNRRVRWARIGVPGEDEMKELEEWLDTFRAELLEGDSRCRQVWCGNGRCEAGEAGRCEEDCGTPAEAAPSERVVSGPTEVAVVGPSEVAPTATDVAKRPAKKARPCPQECPRCDDEGRCLTLWGRAEPPPASAPAPGCGDGLCGPGEDSKTCCRDCGCSGALQCRRGEGERDVCLPAKLWPD